MKNDIFNIALLTVLAGAGYFIYFKKPSGQIVPNIKKEPTMNRSSSVASAGSARATQQTRPTPFMNIAERFNNPLNIKFNPANNWVGQDTARSDNFVYFTSPEMGYRAAFILLKNYVAKGFNTIEKVVNRWARETPGEDLSNYINFVSDKTGLFSGTPLKQSDFASVIGAMAMFEGGGQVDLSKLQKGYQLAFG